MKDHKLAGKHKAVSALTKPNATAMRTESLKVPGNTSLHEEKSPPHQVPKDVKRSVEFNYCCGISRFIAYFPRQRTH